MSTRAEELVVQQKSLAEQLRQAQLTQNQSSYSQGQRALKEQLRQQRVESQASRSQLSEQSYLANRAISQGATSRGLGSSGLKNLALIQSQMAQGAGVNQLAQSNANVQNAAMNTQLSLNEQLANSTNAANATYSQNVIDADKYGLQVDAERRDTLMQLYQMALENGSASDISKLAALSGLDMSTLSETEQAALSSATTDAKGDVGYTRTLGNTIAAGLVDMTTAGTAAGYFADVAPHFKNDVIGDQKFKDWTEALDYVNNVYKDFEGYGDIKVVRKGNGIKFEYKGTTYKTYNEALAKYNTYK